MKIKIKTTGIYGSKGQAVPVGSVHSINSELPEGWKGLVDIVEDAASDESKGLNNTDYQPPSPEEVDRMKKEDVLHHLNQLEVEGFDPSAGVRELRAVLLSALEEDQE